MARGKKKTDTRQFWAGDCETDPFLFDRVPQPFLWGLYTGITYHEFKTPQEFVDYIKDQEVIIGFHNGGKFDLHFLLAWINLAEEVKVINGRMVIAHIGKAEIRDTWNILPVPLRKIGNKLDIEYWKLEKEHREKHMPEISAYLKQDCVGLWDAVTKFEAKYGRHLTLAGACAANWKLISGLKMPKSDRDFFAKFNDYYAGGRVQVFQKGHVNGPGKFFDIRSAYAWAMLSEHPYEIDYNETLFPKSILPTSLVKLECVSSGGLFYRGENGSITFPDDDELRTYHVTGHEYFAALETGTLRRVKLLHSIDFTGLQSFATYIHHHYDERKIARKEGDEAQTEFSKLFMNSLYGKFAANPDNYGNFMCVDFADMCNHEGYTFDGMIGPHALLKAPLDPWQENFINVATAASITGMVRAKLWRAIHASTMPIYCDTDSLVCGDAPNLEIGEELGQWNLEGTWDDAYIAGKKMYVVYGQFEKGKTEKLASKGVRLSADEIKRAAMGETITARNDAPTFTIKGKRKVYFQTRNVKATG